MKKLFILFLCICITGTTLAEDITSPFYIVNKGSFASTTQAFYTSFRVKGLTNGYTNYRTWDKSLIQNLAYGLSNTSMIDIQISNNWDRLKLDGCALTNKTDSNINWHIGGTYNFYNHNNNLIQAFVRYLQKETHHSRGSYKALEGTIRAGHDFNFILTYTDIMAQLPTFQSSQSDNDQKYRTSFGLYKKWSYFTFDTKLNYRYDCHFASKKWDAELATYFYLTETLALGGYFSYTFQDKGKNNAEATGKTIGLTLKTKF